MNQKRKHYEINCILKRKNRECAACLKYLVLIFVEKKYKMQHLEDSGTPVLYTGRTVLNPLNAKLNPICLLLELLLAHPILHISRIRVKS
jgi:hypothetical protein